MNWSPTASLTQPVTLNPATPTAQAIETPEQREQVAKEFESVFMTLLLKNMRDTFTEDGLFGKEASDTFGGLFDLYMGNHLAESGSLGIGEMIQDLYKETSL